MTFCRSLFGSISQQVADGESSETSSTSQEPSSLNEVPQRDEWESQAPEVQPYDKEAEASIVTDPDTAFESREGTSINSESSLNIATEEEITPEFVGVQSPVLDTMMDQQPSGLVPQSLVSPEELIAAMEELASSTEPASEEEKMEAVPYILASQGEEALMTTSSVAIQESDSAVARDPRPSSTASAEASVMERNSFSSGPLTVDDHGTGAEVPSALAMASMTGQLQPECPDQGPQSLDSLACFTSDVLDVYPASSGSFEASLQSSVGQPVQRNSSQELVCETDPGQCTTGGCQPFEGSPVYAGAQASPDSVTVRALTELPPCKDLFNVGVNSSLPLCHCHSTPSISA